MNHFPIDRTDIHMAIAKRFASSRFSKMTQDDIETPEISYGTSIPYFIADCDRSKALSEAT
jgi:hypothetical protein